MRLTHVYVIETFTSVQLWFQCQKKNLRTVLKYLNIDQLVLSQCFIKFLKYAVLQGLPQYLSLIMYKMGFS